MPDLARRRAPLVSDRKQEPRGGPLIELDQWKKVGGDTDLRREDHQGGKHYRQNAQYQH